MNKFSLYLQRFAHMMMLGLVLMAGFSASMNMLLSHDVMPAASLNLVEAHMLDPDGHGHHHESEIVETEDLFSHKHVHNAADHSHETPVTLQRKPVRIIRHASKVTFPMPSIPVSNVFYGLDRPPAVG